MSGKVKIQLYALTLALGQLSASFPSCFTSGETVHGIYCTGGWVSSRDGGCYGEDKNF